MTSFVDDLLQFRHDPRKEPGGGTEAEGKGTKLERPVLVHEPEEPPGPRMDRDMEIGVLEVHAVGPETWVQRLPDGLNRLHLEVGDIEKQVQGAQVDDGPYAA